MSRVTCQLSGVRCCMSGVTCTFNSQTVRARKLLFHSPTSHRKYRRNKDMKGTFQLTGYGKRSWEGCKAVRGTHYYEEGRCPRSSSFSCNRQSTTTFTSFSLSFVLHSYFGNEGGRNTSRAFFSPMSIYISS